MAKTRRTREVTAGQARGRLRSAQAYLEVAELVLADLDRAEMPGVAAGLAVLAGIAGSDVICACRLGQVHRGDDHRADAALLEEAIPDGNKLALTFRRLIDMKDEAHYGLLNVAPQRARSAVRWASQLVDRAQLELER